MRPYHLLSVAVVVATLPIVARAAQTPPSVSALPVGIVEDACVGTPVMPVAVLRYFTAALAIDPQPGSPPAAEMAAYNAAQTAAKARDWAELCHYRADNARLVALPARARRIVYMGDSITQAWGVADPAFFSNGRVDRGISGQTTAQMLVRFQSDVVALHPAIVHILAGTNDVAGNQGPETEQDVRNNIIAMVTLAKANRIRVVLGSIPPAARFPWRPALHPAAQIRALNVWLRAYARTVGAGYVDYHRALATSEGGMQSQFTLDGVHPNGRGYQAMKPLSEAATR